MTYISMTHIHRKQTSVNRFIQFKALFVIKKK